VREGRPLEPLQQIALARPPAGGERGAPRCQRQIEKQLDAGELQRSDPRQRLELLEGEQRRQNHQRGAPTRPQPLDAARPQHQIRS
jgi:hypothetical protein